MWALEALPPCFLKDFDSGLGMAPPYKCIVTAVEMLTGCSEIVISTDYETGAEESSEQCRISTDDLDKLRKAINRTINRGRNAFNSVNEGTTYNFLADKLGKQPTTVKFGLHPQRRQLTEALLRGDDALAPGEQDLVVDALLKNVDSIATTRPSKLVSLKEDIELANLDAVIRSYSDMVNDKSRESKVAEIPGAKWIHLESNLRLSGFVDRRTAIGWWVQHLRYRW